MISNRQPGRSRATGILDSLPRFFCLRAVSNRNIKSLARPVAIRPLPINIGMHHDMPHGPHRELFLLAKCGFRNSNRSRLRLAVAEHTENEGLAIDA
jgi:hypothetical protein